jgi:hypothetical protein
MGIANFDEMLKVSLLPMAPEEFRIQCYSDCISIPILFVLYPFHQSVEWDDNMTPGNELLLTYLNPRLCRGERNKQKCRG